MTNEREFRVDSVSIGPGDLYLGGSYLVDMPPLAIKCADLTEWLNDKSKKGWRFQGTYNGMFIFRRA